MQKDWQAFEDDILREFYPTYSWPKCSELLGRSKPSIKNRAYKLGLNVKAEIRPKLVYSKLGSKHSEETKLKMSLQRKGVPKSEAFKDKMSLRMLGDKHPNWQGGRSLLPYTDDFNPRIKKIILSRDNYICQKCGATKPKRLVVHHIDWDKNNSVTDNLITVCITCHNKHHHSYNINVEDEKQYFKSVIERIRESNR